MPNRLAHNPLQCRPLGLALLPVGEHHEAAVFGEPLEQSLRIGDLDFFFLGLGAAVEDEPDAVFAVLGAQVDGCDQR
ncbi:MAG: hypothetical protein L0Y58_25350 [Verrucomicrobia subdivision 3 bacterium]|nr:hypothetical protein [Gemmataceae bacterium]MCI0748748.1 hypothetical protein [Limisphaerales bacterium]